jgi:hypothetical protein
MIKPNDWDDLLEPGPLAETIRDHARALNAGFTVAEIARWGLDDITAGLSVPACTDIAALVGRK